MRLMHMVKAGLRLSPKYLTLLLCLALAAGWGADHRMQQRRQQRSMELARMQASVLMIDLELRHLMVQTAGHQPPHDFAPIEARMAQDLNGLINSLQTPLMRSGSAAQQEKMQQLRRKLDIYKGAISWMGTMLAADFPAAYAFYTPYRQHVEAIVQAFAELEA